MTTLAPQFAMVAGEASGELLAQSLIEGLKMRWPQAGFAGIGGAKMVAQGFDAWWPSEKLAVRGYVEVLSHYREIVGIRSKLKKRLLARKPDLFIGVDAPDFNLDLESELKASGIKTVHYVCPSVWAWRPERIDKIRRSANHVLCIFPFEVELLQNNGIDASYIGHPLANHIPITVDRLAARQALGLDPDAQVIAVLPGSRKSEIHYLAPRFFETVALIQRSYSAIKFVVPCVPSLRSLVAQAAKAAHVSHLVTLLDGQSHQALAACDVTLIASGTATLEAALFKRPMVIAYSMNWLSWQIMRHKKLQPWVGLPNILCRDFVVPEFLQDAATPPVLARAVMDWLDQPMKARELTQKFTDLHLLLQRDTNHLATDAIQKVLEA